MLFASFSGTIVDKTTFKPINNAILSDSANSVKSDKNGYFTIDSNETLFHVKAYGYRPFSVSNEMNNSVLEVEPITVKALYLTFWGASNNSNTSKRVFEIIDKTEANAVVVDIKNEYGSTLFWTSFEQANSYGAYKKRTNRDIAKFMKKLKDKNIYTIARVVTFKDELQASNNPDYAIKLDSNGSIWRNHDNMAWVDPYDKRSHEYAISVAEEAAKVGFDEINFDYIRFPAKKRLRYSKNNSLKNQLNMLTIYHRCYTHQDLQKDPFTLKIHPNTLMMLYIEVSKIFETELIASGLDLGYNTLKIMHINADSIKKVKFVIKFVLQRI